MSVPECFPKGRKKERRERKKRKKNETKKGANTVENGSLEKRFRFRFRYSTFGEEGREEEEEEG